MEEAKEKFDQLVIEKKLEGEMSASLSPFGLKIELSSNSLFNSGSAEVKGSMQSSLTDLSEIIQGLGENDYIVEVEGHTDNVPINTAKFPSNWELSSLRAVNVAKVFEAMGVKKISSRQLHTQIPGPSNPMKILKALPSQKIKPLIAEWWFTSKA